MLNRPKTIFLNRQKAAGLVFKLNSDPDNEWEYTLVSNKRGGFIVEIKDESGTFLGYL